MFLLLFPSHRLFLTLWQWNFRFSLFFASPSINVACSSFVTLMGNLNSQCAKCKATDDDSLCLW
jgi:hypothetical protein